MVTLSKPISFSSSLAGTLLSALFVLLIALSPTFAAIYTVPQGWVWTGILSRNTADVNGYLSIVEEVRQGTFRTRNLYTAEPHPVFQIRPFYATLGFIGRLVPGVSTVALMETARFIACSALLLLLLLLTKRLFHTGRDRMISFLTLALGSGLGWTGLVVDPPDLRIVETSTFLAFLSPPLFPLSLSLLLGTILTLTSAWEASDKRRAVLYSCFSGILAMWLGFDRPFSLGPLAFSVVFTLGWFHWSKDLNRSRILRTLPLLAGSSIAILYQLMTVRGLAVYAEWNRQHILPTPEFFRLLMSYGFFIPLAILGFKPLLQRNKIIGLLFGFFFAGSMLFSHLPFQFQERFLEGSPLCLATMAASGLILLLKQSESPIKQTLFAGVALVLLMPSSYFGLLRDFQALGRKNAPQFVPAKFVEGMKALTTLAAKEEAIFSSQASGNYIPAYSARPVVLGHQVQTARVSEKQRLVADFFSLQAQDPHAAELFRKSGATWLFWSPEEAWLSAGRFLPSEAPFLERKYSNGMVSLYRIH